MTEHEQQRTKQKSGDTPVREREEESKSKDNVMPVPLINQFRSLVIVIQQCVGSGIYDMPEGRRQLVAWYRLLPDAQRKELAQEGRQHLTRAKQITEALYQEFSEITSSYV